MIVESHSQAVKLPTQISGCWVLFPGLRNQWLLENEGENRFMSLKPYGKTRCSKWATTLEWPFKIQANNNKCFNCKLKYKDYFWCPSIFPSLRKWMISMITIQLFHDGINSGSKEENLQKPPEAKQSGDSFWSKLFSFIQVQASGERRLIGKHWCSRIKNSQLSNRPVIGQSLPPGARFLLKPKKNEPRRGAEVWFALRPLELHYG